MRGTLPSDDRWVSMEYRSPPIAPAEKVIAIGLLTQRDLDTLGVDLRRVYPVDDLPRFEDLLRSIDEADRASQRKGDS